MEFSIGIKPRDESELEVRFNNFELGTIDLQTGVFEATLGKESNMQNNTLPIC